MERTPRDKNVLSVEEGNPVEFAAVGDLMDAAFIEEFVEQEGRFRVTYDPTQATPSLAIIAVVSTITGIDPLDLDPIYESIDADALDALFTGDNSSVSRLTFQYSGYQITIGTDDIVEIVAW